MSSPAETAVTLVAEALAIAPEAARTAALGLTEGWDSVAHMRLVLALEAHLGRPLEPEQIVSIGAVEDVAKLLEAA